MGEGFLEIELTNCHSTETVQVVICKRLAFKILLFVPLVEKLSVTAHVRHEMYTITFRTRSGARSGLTVEEGDTEYDNDIWGDLSN